MKRRSVRELVETLREQVELLTIENKKLHTRTLVLDAAVQRSGILYWAVGRLSEWVVDKGQRKEIRKALEEEGISPPPALGSSRKSRRRRRRRRASKVSQPQG